MHEGTTVMQVVPSEKVHGWHAADETARSVDASADAHTRLRILNENQAPHVFRRRATPGAPKAGSVHRIQPSHYEMYQVQSNDTQRTDWADFIIGELEHRNWTIGNPAELLFDSRRTQEICVSGCLGDRLRPQHPTGGLEPWLPAT